MVKAEDIVGTWVMVDRGTDSEEDRAQARQRYGDNPQGFMIVAPDGWMSAIVCWGDRPAMTGNPAWHSDAPDADRLRAFDTYLSYAGAWRVENGRLSTTVHYALNPGWIGGEQARGLELTPDGKLKLLLSRAWPDGRTMTGWVLWRRAEKLR